MFKNLFSLVVLALLFAGLNSCSKTEVAEVADPQQLDQSVLNRIQALGFHTEGAIAVEDGYVVEGDIFLTEEDLNAVFVDIQSLIVANCEQYRTTNLVTGLPRVIKVSISSQLPSSYGAALDEAINRYNAENLQVTFQKVSSGANISIVKKCGNYLASAGFPTSNGNPYSKVNVNSCYLGQNPGTNYLATILAHELGHCIGFRHTDYMDRSYSCGGSPVNEGASTVGAIHIPGTPTGPDANSWMLACIGAGQNRPFNNNDKTALNYLY
ncbi:MAG: protease [Haliscomenobacteraceae bacterium CHB4]|nr:hypothetical protein [Saprospiraceae bacterium]MCE7922907.1 protease [Haliscomenobacteraceae bacterium CHB4]